MDLTARGLNDSDQPILGRLTPSQNRGILIAGLTCACISLATTLLTLRWFVVMKRLFRHQLVLYLIVSDTFKALWYFLGPIVVFARGSVSSSSKWCQASGFFLSLAIEASDFAILLIALHAVLYIFRPPIRFGEGGLYPYRYWLPFVWLIFPILSASLAFVNSGDAYVTAGTYCYLPQRPFWYRLALAWVPRYIIISAIILMYASISIYVHIKFRGFKNLANTDSQSGDNSARNGSLADSGDCDEKVSPIGSAIQNSQAHGTNSGLPSRSHSYQSPFSTASNMSPAVRNPQPWDAMNFMTCKPIQDSSMHNSGVESADFARNCVSPFSTTLPTNGVDVPERKSSEMTFATDRTVVENTPEVTNTTTQKSSSASPKLVVDPLKRTRMAIRQQLRFLFIYPVVYVLMWIFPFAQHCLTWSDERASHPIFWLNVIVTCSMSLQACANCLVFSWREKPWRRVDTDSKFSVVFWRQRSIDIIKDATNKSRNSSLLFRNADGTDTDPNTRRNTGASDSAGTEAGDNLGDLEANRPGGSSSCNRPTRPVTWWEAEGKKRKDSVWLGTDLMSQLTNITTRRSKENKDNDLRSIRTGHSVKSVESDDKSEKKSIDRD